MRKLLVTGDRRWSDYHLVLDHLRSVVAEWQEPFMVVNGGAQGADFQAQRACSHLSLHCRTTPAEWDRYGKAAGMMRNQRMLDENHEIELVLAFHDHLGESKGTFDMVRRALNKGIKVIHIQHDHAPIELGQSQGSML